MLGANIASRPFHRQIILNANFGQISFSDVKHTSNLHPMAFRNNVINSMRNGKRARTAAASGRTRFIDRSPCAFVH